jgi:hypothetical protein
VRVVVKSLANEMRRCATSSDREPNLTQLRCLLYAGAVLMEQLEDQLYEEMARRAPPTMRDLDSSYAAGRPGNAAPRGGLGHD